MKKYFALLFAIAAFSVANAQTVEWNTDFGYTWLFLLGTTNLPLVLASFVFNLIGNTGALYVRAKNGVKTNENTPDKMQLSIAFSDKIFQFAMSILAGALIMRFTSFFVAKKVGDYFSIDYSIVTLCYALFLGVIGYFLWNYIVVLFELIFSLGKNSISNFLFNIFKQKPTNENNG